MNRLILKLPANQPSSKRSLMSIATRYSATSTAAWGRLSQAQAPNQQRLACTKSERDQRKSQCNESQTASAAPSKAQFWTSKQIWARAAVNTWRCLVGCTIGDFSAMWLLQMYYSEIGIGTIMAISSMFCLRRKVRTSLTYIKWLAASRHPSYSKPPYFAMDGMAWAGWQPRKRRLV